MEKYPLGLFVRYEYSKVRIVREPTDHPLTKCDFQNSHDEVAPCETQSYSKHCFLTIVRYMYGCGKLYGQPILHRNQTTQPDDCGSRSERQVGGQRRKCAAAERRAALIIHRRGTQSYDQSVSVWMWLDNAASLPVDYCMLAPFTCPAATDDTNVTMATAALQQQQ